MTVELKIPSAGESVQEVQIGRWLKREGDAVDVDENIVELETDKASLELAAPAAGTLKEILKKEGEAVSIGETIGYIEEGEGNQQQAQTAAKQKGQASGSKAHKGEREREQESRPSRDGVSETATQEPDDSHDDGPEIVTPAARRLLRKHGLTAEEIETSEGRLRPEDVRRHLEGQGDNGEEKSERDSVDTEAESHLEEVVPMSLIRRQIARRLVEAQQNAALLTTFNEIDMSAVISLRKQFAGKFTDKYGIKLGFMSFFVKAAIDALKQFPELNAEIRGSDIVYRNYYHVGIAIASEKGLVVPVLRHAERMSFADIELAIDDFASRARENKLKPDELESGTFTISNGGIYGSLLSTPIVNPPQSGVLGMHAIEERPVARDGEVVIRPMMYVALSYDHRIVDGRGAVLCLSRIKEAIQQPSRMLLEV